MPSSRHHAEWLSLIEVAGPFLTLPVLERVFPQGLDKDDSPEAKEHARNLRLAYDEWDDNQSGHRPNPAIHKAWIDFVLKQTLGFSKEAHAEFDESVYVEAQAVPQTLKAIISEHGEVLRPDVVVRNPEGVSHAAKARLLVQVYPVEQDLEKPVAGRHWKASPATRMMEVLHATDVRLGLVTNGEHWMLVDAPRGDTTGFASWYASLWFDEPLTLRAFRSLLGVSRFFSVTDDETLEAMLKESAEHQQEVTDQLGLQVRRAVEVLIQSLDRADSDHGRELLAHVPEAVLYEAALTVMMRLVFLFSAEERGLLLLGDPLYDQHYAVSTLVAQLQESADQNGEEVLERRLDAWVRLLSTFRAVFGGVKHERMKLPAYAGNLFNPDRFPFLEGRRPGTAWRDTPATPLPVNNRTVLHLLRALQYLQGEHKEDPAVRLSFQSLDIEQIGHVYEGLLDHTAKRTPEPILGLAGAKGAENEVPLAELERLQAKGEADLLTYLNDQTGRQEKTLKKILATPLDGEDAKKLRAVCGNDAALFQRVRPFSGLLRNDTFDRPVVIRKGSVFVTAGTDRRSSGTHYTPRTLTEPIVQYTLEPLVYIGPAEGLPKYEWKLRSARELLDLKICDMACGSGAFLVQSCRYFSERLLEAWEKSEQEAQNSHQNDLFEKKDRTTSGVRITPFGFPSEAVLYEQLVPVDLTERLTYARRIVAQRCLYGVDKNPLAVEMAKLSLWLLTLAKDKPFEFLDHAIRCGDSLVGISNIEQLRSYSLQPDEPNTIKFSGPLDAAVDEAISLRLKLEGLPSNTIEDVERQEQLLKEANDKITRLRCAADLLVAGEFWGESPKDKVERVRHNAVRSGHYVENGPTEEFERVAAKERRGQLMFHWPLEFPEILVKRGGFDAFVCNPPFMGGQKLTGTFGDNYRELLVTHLAHGKRGSADLCAYFFLRAAHLLKRDGQFGFLATNTIAQGDTRDVGLDQLAEEGCVIIRAVPSHPWPGHANLEVAHVWLRRGSWSGLFLLDNSVVSTIATSLTESSLSAFRLVANNDKSYIGSIPLGGGFLLNPEEANSFIQKDGRNRQVLLPYLSGDDLLTRPDHSPSRWVIDFKDWPLERAEKYEDLIRIVREKVKPERDTNKRKPRRERWWQFAERSTALYQKIRGLKRVLFHSFTSKYVAFAFVPSTYSYAGPHVVVASEAYSDFAILQSAFHEKWAFARCSTHETRLRYAPSDLLETFPFPRATDALAGVGSQYYEFRKRCMTSSSFGLTQTYNRYHNPDETSTDIQKLRELHVEMDQEVAAAYGWADLHLDYGFHETKQGVRFTISEPARREVLQRLLKLNHERYAEENKQGLHEKRKPKKPSRGRGRKSSATTEGATLFGNDDDESDPTFDDAGDEEMTAQTTRQKRSAPRADREENS